MVPTTGAMVARLTALEALIGKQSIMLEALLAGSKDNSMS